MDFQIPTAATAELAAAFLQAAVTLGLAAVCVLLYRRHHKPWFGWWSVAWTLYTVRLGAIISFLLTADRIWLYWHQVATGWTALALLWAALVFAQHVRWRRVYLAFVLFPLAWSYIAIYKLHVFLLAAGPAVLFLSGATLLTAWAFARFHRQVGSGAAGFLAVTFLLWGLHHLDYPFLRARGIWNPWGYYIDILFTLVMGAGMLLLVEEDLHRGLGALSALSGELRAGGRGARLDALLKRPLGLPAVHGSALCLFENGEMRFVHGVGACASWPAIVPTPETRSVVETAIAKRTFAFVDGGGNDDGYAYIAALPVLERDTARGALVVVGMARDPFAALDTRFLVALGQQVGAALENAELYDQLEERKTQLERLASRMVRQHEDERRRLSRELHDESAQLLAAVSMQLGLLRESARADQAEGLDRALALVREGIGAIRGVTEDLRPPLLDDLGLFPALRALADDFAERHQVHIHFDAPDDAPSLGDDGELALFRALQEALSNIARHAGATTVGITVAVRAGGVSMCVRDDGHGLNRDPSPGPPAGGMGLAGMRERIASLGGALDVREPAGGGVELTMELPAEATGG